MFNLEELQFLIACASNAPIQGLDGVKIKGTCLLKLAELAELAEPPKPAKKKPTKKKTAKK